MKKKPFNNSNVKRLGSAIAENTQKVRLNEFQKNKKGVFFIIDLYFTV